ncbi:MAG: porin family protein [Bradyrhizobiaceae bacterium]|nr:porin family protein [Bradyrhizobiaceae bacterium]
MRNSVRFGLATVLLSSAAVVSQTVVSNAADVAAAAPAAAAPYPYSWSGLYAGGDVGFGWVNSGNSNFVGGGQLGYNWQNYRWVFGVEGDVSGTSVPGLNWANTLGARVGYAFDPRWFAFGKFGGGWLNYSNGAGTSTSAVFGIGAEYELGHRWSAKVEYDYWDLGGSRAGSSSFNTLKAGVNYRFGPGLPF